MPNPKNEADQLIARGRMLLEQGDLPTATRLLNDAVKLYWAAGDYYNAAAQTGNYGWVLRRSGQVDLARPYLEQAAGIFEQIGLTDFAERHRAAAGAEATILDPAILETLPPAVRGAIERGDGDALQAAIDTLQLAEQQIVYERLIEAGIIVDPEQADAEQALQQFDVLLQDIAAATRDTDAQARQEINAALTDLERKGWQLRQPVEQIWAGERDPQRLTQHLDPTDARIVQRLLELI
jgi:tetratricopeptide (TPR) repeat protein